MNKLLLTICLIWFSSSAALAETAGLSLKECEKAALMNSNRIAGDAAATRQADADFNEAKGQKFGGVDLTGSYGYTSETMEINFSIPGTPISRKISFGDGNSYDLAAVAKVPLYTGGAVKSRIAASQSSHRATVEQLSMDSVAVAYETRLAYFAVLGAKERLGATQLAAERISRHIAELDSSLKIGVGTEESKLQAVARQNQALVAVNAAESDLAVAKLQLGRVIGMAGTSVDPVGSLSDSLRLPVNLESNLSERPDVRTTEYRIEQSRFAEEGAKAAWLPTVSAMTAYHYAKPGINQAENDWMGYGVIGVNAAWTIHDWGVRSARMQKAKATTDALESRLADLKATNKTMIASAKAKLSAAKEAMIPTTRQIEVETARRNLIERRLKLGAGSESEYLDVLDDLSVAESNLALANLKCRLAEAELLYALAYIPK